MAQHEAPHRWGEIYDFNATSYRECADPECLAHQQWVCAIDRWSEPFDGPSPRQRDEVRRRELTEARSQATR